MMERLVARPLDRTFVNAMFIILATTAIVTKLVRGKQMFGFTFGWALPWSVAFNHKFHFINFFFIKTVDCVYDEVVLIGSMLAMSGASS